MLRLKVADMLKENNKSKYWLAKQFDMTYQNFCKMIDNNTQSIKYSVLEKLCEIFHCDIGDLFEKI